MSRKNVNVPLPTDFFKTSLGCHMVGFDQVIKDFLGSNDFASNTSGYPPYNVTRLTTVPTDSTESEVSYEVTLALAGFTKDDIEIINENNHLKISGKSSALEESQGSQVEYIHKGIAERSFTRTFNLASNVEVKSASLKDGILKVVLVQIVPEELQPKRIAINTN